jgi:coenzyme Q-binding protein COQ10
VVADVERCPTFLPGCREVRLLLPAGAARRAHVVYGLSRMLSFAYDCRIHEEPGPILVEGERGAFRHVRTVWRFEEAGPSACDVSFVFEADFASPAMAWAGTRVLETAASGMLEAFRRRADRLAASSPGAC